MLSVLVRAPARLVLPLAVLAATAPLAAQQVPQQTTQQQREHTVRRGDTLWDLARFYLGNPFLWPTIFEANRNVVENPHWIYPLERLLIPPLVPPPAAQPAETPQPVTTTEPQGWTPPTREPAAVPVMHEAPVAQLDLRRAAVTGDEYRSAPWLSASAEREILGRIVQAYDPAGATDRLASGLHGGERAWVGQLARSARVGDSLLVVRFGRRVADRGRVVEPLAVLRVDSVAGSVLLVRVARHFGELRVGDAVMPLPPTPAMGLGEAQPVSRGTEGQLLEFLRPEPLRAPTDLAFISVGSADGVGIGDEFAVFVPARAVSRGGDVLPPTDVATVRVVRVMDRTATVRVLAINSTALRDGLPVRMIRKMP